MDAVLCVLGVLCSKWQTASYVKGREARGVSVRVCVREMFVHYQDLGQPAGGTETVSTPQCIDLIENAYHSTCAQAALRNYLCLPFCLPTCGIWEQCKYSVESLKNSVLFCAFVLIPQCIQKHSMWSLYTLEFPTLFLYAVVQQ